MEVIIDNRAGVELPLGRIEELAVFVLNREAFLSNLELSLSFVTVKEMTELNTLHRGVAKATDVLSFELDDPWEAVGAHLQASPEKNLKTDGGAQGEERILIGDVVIQPDRARERAQNEGVEFEEELWILVIHGILHLMGYDHKEEDEAAAMERREDEHFYEWELKMGRPSA
ncbi:MAG: rRNA maturation RNase YbeY [Coriobacteriales bacterium]|jgi:probable rRNA maturation factor|nr:rRNA maturation RNase YbeY [Coriobacteriales bacterium]